MIKLTTSLYRGDQMREERADRDTLEHVEAISDKGERANGVA